MQASVGEAKTDVFDIDTGEYAGFFKRQHVGSDATHRTVGAQFPGDDPLLFEEGNFDSSFSREHGSGATISASQTELRATDTNLRERFKSGRNSEINRTFPIFLTCYERVS